MTLQLTASCSRFYEVMILTKKQNLNHHMFFSRPLPSFLSVGLIFQTISTCFYLKYFMIDENIRHYQKLASGFQRLRVPNVQRHWSGQRQPMSGLGYFSPYNQRKAMMRSPPHDTSLKTRDWVHPATHHIKNEKVSKFLLQQQNAFPFKHTNPKKAYERFKTRAASSQLKH